jgi:hypothetical protein
MVGYLHTEDSTAHDNEQDAVSSFMRPNIESGQITFAEFNEEEY